MASKVKYNGKELEDELGKDTYSYGWRDYDPALGRFNKIDRFAEKYQNLSPYSYAANNPIRLLDIQGDSLSGVARKDARRARRIIKKNFRGKNRKLRKLFRTKGAGFKKINNSDLAEASEGVDEEAATLASAYATAINSEDIHRVEVIKRKDELSKFSKENTALYFMGNRTGADIDKNFGGGVNAWDSKDGTLTVLVKNSNVLVPTFDTKTNSIISLKGNISSTFSHEFLGHGYGRVINSSGSEHIDAIQMGNLSLRVQRLGRYQRNGHAHKTNGTLAPIQYSGVPTHFSQ